MTQIKNKKILITGGASGIGRKIALLMAKEAGEIILWDIDRERMQKVQAEIVALGGRTRTFFCDVSKRDEVYKTAAEVGEIDILINNAGVVVGKPILELPDDMIERSLAVNLMAYFWTVKAFLPAMIKKNAGHIVTISSAAGIIGVYRLADYNAAKFGAFGLDESIRFEMRTRRIKVKTTVVCPYYIDTGMFKGVKTRFPFLLPILKEDDVSRQVVAGIKKNKKRVIMPWIVYTVWLLRLLPPFFFDFMASFLGISNTMDEFTGRKK